MNNGWIKLHRKILDKGYYKKSQYVHLWIHLLLKANHKEHEFMWNNEIIIIKEGQLLTGRKELSKETGIPQTTIENILKLLENEHQIGQQKTTKFRVITIVNWKQHQKLDSKSDNRVTTDGQQMDTNKNIKKDKNDKKDISANADFIDTLINDFSEIYLITKEIDYKLAKGKDRTGMSGILQFYKKKNPDSDSEKTRDDLKKLFQMVLVYDFKNVFLNGVTISKLNSNFNEYGQAFKQISNKGFDPSSNDCWSRTLSNTEV